MKANCISIPKYPTSYTNEDAVGKGGNYIVVSDGAGGGGVYADKWSQYLVDNLPDTPITSFEELDNWVGNIWEAFYQSYEVEAMKVGGMLLQKFYDEGSFATLAAVWVQENNICQWMTYGDSVAFCYNYETKKLDHSFGKLVDFNNPPYLVSLNDPLKQEGFRQGNFETNEKSIVFVASDALSHYIIMMYEISHKEQYREELQTSLNAHSRNSNAIKMALSLDRINFEKDVLGKLITCINHKQNMQRHLDSLKRKGLLLEDDYSMAITRI